jgi:hypothetical protein
MSGEAYACVCADRTPQERMAAADAAFYGQVSAIRSEKGERVYTVRIARAYKGQLGETIEVRGADPDAGGMSSCDVTLRQGQSFGAFVESDFRIGVCNMATLQELESGAQVFPKPTGRGRAVALLTGPFANASFAAVGRRGRVIAYARAAGARGPVKLAPCRGGRFLIESATGVLRIRRLADLKAVGRVGARRAESVTCLDRRGRVAIVARANRVLRVANRRSRTLFRGRWRAIETGRFATAVVGRRGLLQLVDSRRGRVRTAVTSGRVPTDMAFSPDGLRLAVLIGRRVTVHDFRGRRLASRRVKKATTQVLWTRGGRLLTLQQQTPNATIVGGQLWWLTQGRLRAVSLRGGSVRTLSVVPQTPFSRLLALPGRPAVRDRSRFTPPSPTSGGYQLPAGRAMAVAAGRRRECAKA